MEFVFVENVQQVLNEALLPAAETLKTVKPKAASRDGKHQNGKPLAAKANHKKAVKKVKAKTVVSNR